jgi:capsular polysaccharide biosynthesis protein
LFLIKKHGYESVIFEDFTIWEQIKMMSEATHFISIHGAGLTNLIFLKDGSSILELVNRQYAQKEYTFPFWKLAQNINVHYYIQLCDAINQNGVVGFGKNKHRATDENDFLVNSNLSVCLDLLLKNISKME